MQKHATTTKANVVNSVVKHCQIVQRLCTEIPVEHKYDHTKTSPASIRYVYLVQTHPSGIVLLYRIFQDYKL